MSLESRAEVSVSSVRDFIIASSFQTSGMFHVAHACLFLEQHTNITFQCFFFFFLECAAGCRCHVVQSILANDCCLIIQVIKISYMLYIIIRMFCMLIIGILAYCELIYHIELWMSMRDVSCLSAQVHGMDT